MIGGRQHVGWTTVFYAYNFFQKHRATERLYLPGNNFIVLLQLIKMIKGWNKENGSLLTSFHLECLILQVMKYQSIADFPSAVRYVFQETRRTIRYAVADPAGYNYNVGAYLNTGNRREEVKSHLESAYRRARKAQEYAAKGKMEEAYSNWQLIFGTYFPVYD